MTNLTSMVPVVVVVCKCSERNLKEEEYYFFARAQLI